MRHGDVRREWERASAADDGRWHWSDFDRGPVLEDSCWRGRPGQDDFRLAKPHEKVGGQTAGEWLEEWWTWILQSPADAVPTNDSTGELAGNQPENPVFFVAGTFGGAATRTFEVPDEPLIVPALNFFNTIDKPNSPDTPVTTKRDINQSIREWPDTVLDVHASIDGEPIEDLDRYLVRTKFYSLGLPEPGSLIEALLLGADSATDQPLNQTRAIGYVLVIDGLDPGEHVLRFGGRLEGGEPGEEDDFVTETIANITVLADSSPIC